MNPEMNDTMRARTWLELNWHWVVVAMIVLTAAAIRIHLLGVPLERDEGEYAYAGQLILQGIPPYAQVYNMKMPGIYAAYAMVMSVFGETPVAIHLGLLIVNAATTLLLFILGRRLFDTFTGITAAAAFALLSLGQPVQGIFANAEHFVILPALGGILLLVNATESRGRTSLFMGSLLLGLAFLMKQHGVAFIALGGLYLFFKEAGRRPFLWKSLIAKCLVYIGGVALPFILTCLILYWTGVFEKFWFWTFDYASQYVSSVPLSAGIGNLTAQLSVITGQATLIWISAAMGLISFLWNKKSREKILFCLLFAVFSFVAISPGLFFRAHYFILLLPAVALFAGIGIGSLYELFNRRAARFAIKVVPVLLVIAVVSHGAWQQREFLFQMGPYEASRSTYNLNPFPESLEIARFIKDNSNEYDRIAVIGSEPQIYFYSNRHSATGHIYTYALMEAHPYALAMQKEMISEIENTKPRFMVFVNISSSWLVKPGSQMLIFDWFKRYSSQYYDLVGIVDINNDFTNFRWNEDSKGYRAQSPIWLSVFRRKN